jgi:hypothetical protein
MPKWLCACLATIGIGRGVRGARAFRPFIRRMHGIAAPFTRARTVVLYTPDPESEPALLGTGIALAVASRRFIVTAAHVLDEALSSNTGVYVSPGAPGGALIPLDHCSVNQSHIPESGNRLDDPFDIAVIALDDSIVEHMGKGITFATIDEVDLNEKARPDGYFFLHGFPQDQFTVVSERQAVHAVSRPYVTVIYAGKRGNWPSQPGPVHTDLDYPSGFRKNIDDFGRRTKLGAPMGMSGCGIWRLYRPGTPPTAWGEHEIKLIAIEHRWRDDLQAIRGTKIIYAMQLIATNFPECDHEIRGRL